MPYLIPVFVALGASAATAAIIVTVIEIVMVVAAIAMGVISYMAAQRAAADARAAQEAIYDAGQRLRVDFSGTQPRNTVYGHIRVGGLAAVVNTTGTTGSHYNILQVLTSHPISGIGNVYLNSDVAQDTNGNCGSNFTSGSTSYFHANFADGTQTGPSPTVITQFGGDITSNHKFTSCSYLAATYISDRYNNVWPQGPVAATIDIDGKKVYDPRDSTTKYSTNPSLCILDYIRDVLKIADRFIDFNGFIEAANDCDGIVTLATNITRSCVFTSGSRNINVQQGVSALTGLYVGLGVSATGIPTGSTISYINNNVGQIEYFSIQNPVTISNSSASVVFGGAGNPEKQYTLNGMISSEQKPSDVLQSLLATCRGRLVFDGGKYCLKVAKWRDPVVTITEGDILDKFSVQTKASTKDSYTGVKGTFIDPSSNFAAASYPSVTSSVFLAMDNGRESYADFPLSFTNSPSMCQRLAKQELYNNRLSMVTVLKVNSKAVVLQPTDNVYVKFDQLGWTAPGKIFEVLSNKVDYTKGQCELTLKETSSDIFAWNATEEQLMSLKGSTTLNNPFYVPVPTSVSVTAGSSDLVKLPDGTILPGANVSWQAEDQRVASVELQYKRSADSTWIQGGSVDNASAQKHLRVTPSSQAENYDFSVRSRSYLGRYSDWVTVTAMVFGKSAAPLTPSTISVTGYAASAVIKWDNNASVDIDYDHTNIYVNSTNTTVGAVLLGNVSATIYTYNGTAGTYYFFLQNVDTSGNVSTTSTGYVGTITSASAGADAISSTLSSYSVALPCDSSGNVISFSGASTTISILIGNVDDSVNWSVTRVAVGCTGDLATRTVTISACSLDSAYVDITATRSGYPTQTKRYTATKVKAGATGASGSAGPTGATGNTGAAGSSGLNTAVVMLYQRSATTPTVPSGTTTYTFSTKTLTPLGLWSQSVPAYTSNPLYITAATATATAPSDTDTIATGEWSSPVVIVMDGSQGLQGIVGPTGGTGAAGQNGLNVATVFIHKRSATVPALPTTTSSYTFSSGTLTGQDNGWTVTVPANDGNPVYVSTATAAAVGTSDTIAPTEWSSPPTVLAANGSQGIQGTTGAAGTAGTNGTNGQTTYFHVAYANSANGSVGFNFSGGTYIGTYVDYTSANSSSYSSYNWVLIKGTDGTNGTAGTNGSNGQTSYLHIKYSNDGGSTFTTNVGEDVGTYIGTYTDFALADSTSVGSYTWALIKGATGNTGAAGSNGACAFTLIAGGACTVGPNTAIKTSGAGGWDAAASTKESYVGGAYCSFRMLSTAQDAMAGLCANPLANNGISIDYAWHINSSGISHIYENGSYVTTTAAITTNTIFSITYDGTSVKYYLDGVIQRTVTPGTSNLKLYFDSTMYEVGSSIIDIAFGPQGATGTPAMTGTLTNDSCTLNADSSGNVASFSTATTTFVIYKGTDDDSGNWTITKTDSSCTSTVSVSTRTVSVSAMSADNAYVDITATRTGGGYSNITKRFSLSKSKSGASAAGSGGALNSTSASGYTYSTSLAQISSVSATSDGQTRMVVFEGYVVNPNAGTNTISIALYRDTTALGTYSTGTMASGQQVSLTFTRYDVSCPAGSHNFILKMSSQSGGQAVCVGTVTIY